MADSKAISCMIIDLGPNMAKEGDDMGSSICDIAVRLARKLYSHRMLHFPGDRCGVIMSGDSETNHCLENDASKQYLNVGLEIDEVSSRQVNAMEAISLPEDVEKGLYKVDLTQSIALAQYLIKANNDLNTRLRFAKQIIIFTSLDTTLGLTTPEQAQSLIHAAQEFKQSINIYAHDMMEFEITTFAESDVAQTVQQWLDAWDYYEENKTTVAKPAEEVASIPDVYKWEEATGLNRAMLTYILYYNINTQQLKDAERLQEYNRRIKELVLRTFAYQTKGLAMTFQQLDLLLDQPYHKAKMLRVKANANLSLGTLGPQLNISMYTYAAQEKIPNASSWNANVDKGGLSTEVEQIEAMADTLGWKRDDKTSPINKERITRDRLYTDNLGNVIDPNEALLGLRYGKEDIITINQQDRAFYQQPTSKDFRILRIIRQEFIPPWYRCGGTDYIVPAKDCIATQHFFSRFVEYCNAKEHRYAILVRAVMRQNAKAQFGVLFPALDLQVGLVGFYYHQLPYKDDIRPFMAKPLYTNLTAEDVTAYNQWRVSYDKEYMRPLKEQYAQEVLGGGGQNRVNAEDIALDDMEDWLIARFDGDFDDMGHDLDGQSVSTHGGSGAYDNIPFIHPYQLKQDDDDVNRNKRYQIKTRLSKVQFAYTPTGHYINPLPKFASFLTHPWFGHSAETLTTTQRVFLEYMDALLLDKEDYSPVKIHNPGLQRFWVALRERTLDPQSNPDTSLETVDNYFLNPHLHNNHELSQHLQALTERLRQQRPCRVEEAVVDARGRKIFTKTKFSQLEDNLKKSDNDMNNNDDNNNNGEQNDTTHKKQQYFELDDNFGSSTGVFVNKNGNGNGGDDGNGNNNTNPDDFNLGNDLIKTEVNNNNPDASPSQQPFGLRGLSLPIMHLQQISEQTPIQDFYSMLQQSMDNTNAINRAFDLFVKMIQNIAFNGGGVGHKLTATLQCLQTLRLACVDYQNPQIYNDLIVEITTKCKAVAKKAWKIKEAYHKLQQQQQMGMYGVYGGMYGGMYQQPQQQFGGMMMGNNNNNNSFYGNNQNMQNQQQQNQQPQTIEVLTNEEYNILSLWDGLRSMCYSLYLITHDQSMKSNIISQQDAFEPFKEEIYEPQQQPQVQQQQQDVVQDNSTLNDQTMADQNTFAQPMGGGDDFDDFDM